jgi:hypothetical protein
MNKCSVEVYYVSFLGNSYCVKVGHLDEFIALHRADFVQRCLTVHGLLFVSLSNFEHPYEWYCRIKTSSPLF